MSVFIRENLECSKMEVEQGSYWVSYLNENVYPMTDSSNTFINLWE